MDIRSLLKKLDGIQEAGLDAQQQAQNVMQPGTNVDKEKEYARAQQQMDRLEKAAKYSGDDEIVRKRMGLPPKLPSIDQWDGKMPQPTGKPDWFARLGSLGKATGDQDSAVAANKADDANVAFKKEKLTKLNDLISQLQKLSGSSNTSNATANTSTAPNMGQVNKGGYDPKANNLAESSIFKTLLKEFQDQVLDIDEAAGPEAQKIIDQIKSIMSELGDMGDDQEVNNALQSAQTAIDDANKAPAASASTGTADAGADANKATADANKATADAGADANKANDQKAQQPAAGGNDQIKQVQQQLLGLGFTVVGQADGKMGPKTADAIKQFQTMAGITADGKIGPQTLEKLKNGKQIVAQNQLTTSISVIEKLMAKYKIAEESNELDVDSMSISEMKSLVVKNINQFTLSEQMEIMKLVVLSEADIAVPQNVGSGPRSPARQATMAQAASGQVPANNPFGLKPGAQAAQPGALDRLKGFAGQVAGKAKTIGQKVLAKSPVGKLSLLGAGVATGVVTLYNWLKGNEAQLDPADKQELMKNLEVVTKFAKDETAVKALPDDLQKRLQTILAKGEKLAKGGSSGNTAQDVGSAVGAAVKAPFRAVGDLVGKGADAVGSAAKGFWNAE